MIGARFELVGPFDNEMPDYYIIIKDFNWWVYNRAAVVGWMNKNLPQGEDHAQGIIISIPNKEDATMFLLKFGG